MERRYDAIREIKKIQRYIQQIVEEETPSIPPNTTPLLSRMVPNLST